MKKRSVFKKDYDMSLKKVILKLINSGKSEVAKIVGISRHLPSK
jgi:hypothetical protein